MRTTGRITLHHRPSRGGGKFCGRLIASFSRHSNAKYFGFRRRQKCRSADYFCFSLLHTLFRTAGPTRFAIGTAFFVLRASERPRTNPKRTQEKIKTKTSSLSRRSRALRVIAFTLANRLRPVLLFSLRPRGCVRGTSTPACAQVRIVHLRLESARRTRTTAARVARNLEDSLRNCALRSNGSERESEQEHQSSSRRRAKKLERQLSRLHNYIVLRLWSMISHLLRADKIRAEKKSDRVRKEVIARR